MEKVPVAARIFEDDDDPSVWVVSVLDADEDGSCYITAFAGPDAKERAHEYAAAKYVRVLQRGQPELLQ